jgi:membrane-bound lytic murein transglycosylase D
MKQSRLLVVCLAGWVSGCASQKAPVAAPPPPPPPAPVLVEPTPVVVAPPPVATPAPDRIQLAINAAEREFTAGKTEFDQARLVAARDHFDRALDTLMNLPEGARGEPRLQAAFDRLLERISSLDVMALREADGIAEARSEPAAIDELLTASAFDRPTPKATTAETVAADLEHSPSDVPIDLNEKVLGYVELFQGRLRTFMQAGLDRGQRYLPMIQNVFRAEGVPLDLAFIPLVESAFKNTALSRVSARGMWQFMQPTAQEHGLNKFPGPNVSWFVDERSDPEKATRAAAQYLKTLSRMFDGDWNFALASYNGGPGRLQRAARSAKTTDFWKLSATTRYLPRETREYVPMILAAIIIAKNPELYGFTVASAAPLAYETVTIPGALDLKIIAEWAEITVEELQDLNPELRRTTTPMTAHTVKVPIGTAPMIQARLESAESLYRTFKFHTVKRGETVTALARKYGVSSKELREANGLSATARVTTRQTLMIPTRSTTSLPAASSGRPVTTTARATASTPQTYRVRQGDTLFSIARQFSTTTSELKRLNGLSSDRIKIGDRLTVRR